MHKGNNHNHFFVVDMINTKHGGCHLIRCHFEVNMLKRTFEVSQGK
jgi:hypothetical protein